MRFLAFSLTLFCANIVSSHGGNGDDVQRAAGKLVGACDVYDEKAMRASCEELIAFGEPALAVVVPLLDHENANVRWQSVRVLGELDISRRNLETRLASACRDRDADVRGAAIQSLTALFPKSKRARALAIELCQDPHDVVRANAWMARWVLTRDSAAPDRLTALLKSKDWMVSHAAHQHLVIIGKPAVAPVAELAAKGCVAAIQVIGAMNDPVDKIPFLISILKKHATKSKDRTLAAAATHALANAGSAGLKALRDLAAHRDASVRMLALATLSKKPSGHSSLFLKALNDSSTSVRIAAIGGLGAAATGGKDESVARKLVSFLSDPDPDIRGATLSALGLLGVQCVAVANAELRVIAESDPKKHLRQTARAMLVRIAEEDRSADAD